MLISQNILTALRGLMANKLRSALTILGIVIGVAAVVALMAIGNGATSSITSRIEGNGSNLLNIQAGRSQRPAAGAQTASTYLTYKDYQSLAKTLTDVAGIAPAYQARYTIIQGTQSSQTSITGITEDYLKVHTYEIELGRGITANDRSKKSQVAVIGATTASDLFPDSSAIGQAIKINNVTFTVVGLLKSKNQKAPPGLITRMTSFLFRWRPVIASYLAPTPSRTVKKSSMRLPSRPVPPILSILFQRKLRLSCAISITWRRPLKMTSAFPIRPSYFPP